MQRILKVMFLALGLLAASACEVRPGPDDPFPTPGPDGDFMERVSLEQKTAQMLRAFVAANELQPETAQLLNELAANPNRPVLAQLGLTVEDAQPLVRGQMPTEEAIRKVAAQLHEKDETVRALAGEFLSLVR